MLTEKIEKGEVITFAKGSFGVFIFKIRRLPTRITHEKIMADSEIGLELVKKHKIERLIIDQSEIGSHDYEDGTIADFRNKYLEEAAKYLKHIAIVLPTDLITQDQIKATFDPASAFVNIEYFDSVLEAYTWIAPQKNKKDSYLLNTFFLRFLNKIGFQYWVFFTLNSISIYMTYVFNANVKLSNDYLIESIGLLIEEKKMLQKMAIENQKANNDLHNFIMESQLNMMNFLYNKKAK